MKALRVPVNEDLTSPRTGTPDASKVSGFSMRPWTTSLVSPVFLNDAIGVGAAGGRLMSWTFGSQSSVAIRSFPPVMSCDWVCSFGAPSSIGDSRSSEKRSNVPNSAPRPAGKKLLGSNLSAAASAALPASGPCLRDSVDTPMLGVANPPAWSLVKFTPSVVGATAANGSPGAGVSFTISANSALPASNPALT